MLHVVTRGTGTPVVLLHGFVVDHRILLPLDPAFDAHGPWRRLYLDLSWVPHPSGTASSAASTDDVVGEVRRTIDAHVGADEPYLLVGNSFGGMLAARLAHEDPRVRGLALL